MAEYADEARNDDGTFGKGNRFWEARSTHGRHPKYERAIDLNDACEQYFEWVADNPLQQDNLVTFQGAATHEPTSLLRAMTLDGMCTFIGVSRETWTDWRTSRPDLSDVITRAESIIRQQKFEGAAAGLLNATIISRDLGLKDTVANEHTGKDGGPIEYEESPRDRIASRLARLAPAGPAEGGVG